MTHLRATADELDLLSKQYRVIAGVLTRYEFTYPIADIDVASVLSDLTDAVSALGLHVSDPAWNRAEVRFRVRDADERIIYDRTMVAVGSSE